jgi:hypothetical protein
VGDCGWWFCDAGLVAEAENLLMSLVVSTWCWSVSEVVNRRGSMD